MEIRKIDLAGITSSIFLRTVKIRECDDIVNFLFKIKSTMFQRKLIKPKETLCLNAQNRYVSPEVSGVFGYVLPTLFGN